jgi:hypothetical protein
MKSPLALAAIGIGCIALIGHRFLPEFVLLALIGLIVGLVDLIPKLGKDSISWKEIILPLAGVLICAMSLAPLMTGLMKPSQGMQKRK